MALSTTEVLKRLAGPVNMTSGANTPFIGTAAHRYTIKHIRIVNNTAGAVTVKLGIGGTADGNLILHTLSIAANSTYTEDVLIVTDGTETLQANTSATGMTITVSGLDQS